MLPRQSAAMTRATWIRLCPVVLLVVTGCTSSHKFAGAPTTSNASTTMPVSTTIPATSTTMAAPTPTTSGQPACPPPPHLFGGRGGGGRGGRDHLGGGETCFSHSPLSTPSTEEGGASSREHTATGYLGGPGLGATTGAVTSADIVLTTGHEASALFEGWNGPVDSLGPCPSYTAVLVTPPNETHSAQVASDYTLCYLEVHPVVAGGTGGAVDYSP